MLRADARRVLAERQPAARRLRGLVATACTVALLAGCAPSSEPADPPDSPAPSTAPSAREHGDVEDPPREPEETEPAPDEPPDPATPDPPPPPPERERLVAWAQELLDGALDNAGDGTITVLVADEYGREVVAHEPDTPVLPASTVKIVTAAATLITLGASTRLITQVNTTAPIDEAGVVAGDVVLVGGGDPVLATAEYGQWVYPARPRTPLEALADEIVAAGVRRIDGDVVGEATGFTGPRRAEGWPDRYFSDFDARYGDMLTIDAGLRTLVTYPEPDEDEADEDDADADADDPDPEDLGPPIVRVEHVEEPAAQAAFELVRLLDEREVEVTGEARTGEPEGRVVGRLAMIESPPLEDLLRFAVQRSDNQITDGLFLTVARTRTRVASWEQGDRAVRQVLERLGVDHADAHFADGSGLSRDDRVTARLLVDLDRAMLASRHRIVWDSLMAVMGETGTLERRLRGTPAQGRFRGKTGTLRDVAALSGSVVGDDGGRYHLAVIANAAGEARWIARTFADELILLLVADLEGCTVRDAGNVDGPLGRPPLAVAC